MTLEQAKEILKTYKMPLTNEQLSVYRTALSIAQSAMAQVPQ